MLIIRTHEHDDFEKYADFDYDLVIVIFFEFLRINLFVLGLLVIMRFETVGSLGLAVNKSDFVHG